MSAEVEVDLSAVEKRFGRASLAAAQAAFAKRVAFECRDYVPLDEGTLRDSEGVNSDYSAGRIVWATPYAGYVHDMDSVRTVKNSKATPKWPEQAKADRLSAWKEYAQRLLGGGQ